MRGEKRESDEGGRKWGKREKKREKWGWGEVWGRKLFFMKYLNIAELTKVLVGGLILLIPFFLGDVIFYVCSGLCREFNCCEYERYTGECGV